MLCAQKAFTVFQFEVRASLDEWVLYKRYSEFDALHHTLAKMVPNLPPLPPKKLLGKRDPKFVLKRRGELQAYLSALLVHPQLLADDIASEHLQKFLSSENTVVRKANSHRPKSPDDDTTWASSVKQSPPNLARRRRARQRDGAPAAEQAVREVLTWLNDDSLKNKVNILRDFQASMLDSRTSPMPDETILLLLIGEMELDEQGQVNSPKRDESEGEAGQEPLRGLVQLVGDVLDARVVSRAALSVLASLMDPERHKQAQHYMEIFSCLPVDFLQNMRLYDHIRAERGTGGKRDVFYMLGAVKGNRTVEFTGNTVRQLLGDDSLYLEFQDWSKVNLEGFAECATGSKVPTASLELLAHQSPMHSTRSSRQSSRHSSRMGSPERTSQPPSRLNSHAQPPSRLNSFESDASRKTSRSPAVLVQGFNELSMTSVPVGPLPASYPELPSPQWEQSLADAPFRSLAASSIEYALAVLDVRGSAQAVQGRGNGPALSYLQDPPNSAVNIFLDAYSLPHPPGLVKDFLLDLDARQHWASRHHSARVLSRLSSSIDVVHLVFKFAAYSAPLKFKDAVMLRSWKALPDGRVIIVCRSIRHPSCAPALGCVRSSINMAWLITPDGWSASDPVFGAGMSVQQDSPSLLQPAGEEILGEVDVEEPVAAIGGGWDVQPVTHRALGRDKAVHEPAQVMIGFTCRSSSPDPTASPPLSVGAQLPPATAAAVAAAAHSSAAQGQLERKIPPSTKLKYPPGKCWLTYMSSVASNSVEIFSRNLLGQDNEFQENITQEPPRLSNALETWLATALLGPSR